MGKREFTTEHFLYLIAFMCALVIRLIGLGEMPLSEYEASWALQALQVSHGETPTISGQPAYVLLTGFLFTIFNSSDALARFLPAFMGSMVIWLPYALRHQLGRLACIIFAFGLAIDPGLAATSRVAGGPMLALGFGVAMMAAWLLNQPIVAGVLGALFLMSGPSLLTGLLGILIAWVIWSFTSKEIIAVPRPSLRQAAVAAAVTILIAGTLFLRQPKGLAGMTIAIPEFIGGWLNSSGVPWTQVLVALIIYQPLAVSFGLIGLFRSRDWHTPTSRILIYWFFAALGLALVYPSRHVSDLVWVLIPIWGLASYELVRYLRPIPKESQGIAWVQATLILVFMIFYWLNLAGLSNMGYIPIPTEWNTTTITNLYQTSPEFILRYLVVFLLPIVGVITVSIIGTGWSMEAAVNGAVWGALIFLGLYLIGATWSASHIRDRAANELWLPNPTTGHSELLRDTLGDLSEMDTGIRDTIEVVYQIESASLEWALRDMPQARFANQLAPGELPPVIINTQLTLDEPLSSSPYRGQSLTWWIYRYWNQPLPSEFTRWLLYREGPTLSEPVILWARTDLFPGESLPTPLEEETTQSEP